MYSLSSQLMPYEWGSLTALPELLGRPADGKPWAELWFGAHPSAPSRILDDGMGRITLGEAIARRPRHILGDMVLARFGPQLPFLLKLIAPARPLSLQVHPGQDRAREQFAAEDAAGVAREDPERNYRDPNHKPEMLFALTEFEALCGFRTARRAAEILEGLDFPVTERIRALLLERPTAVGMRTAFRTLIAPHLAPPPEIVTAVADECSARRHAGRSPSPRMDAIVESLQDHHPGDPGVLAALLLNPVSLRPGEAMFVPPGDVHAYMSGVGVEIMAASDNVLRAGLTPKHVDVEEMLANVAGTATPPMRIAGENVTTQTQVFYAPVDDFELSITTIDQGERRFEADVIVPGTGPRVLLCLQGDFLAETSYGQKRLRVGEAVFVAADEGALRVGGYGRLAQATVP